MVSTVRLSLAIASKPALRQPEFSAFDSLLRKETFSGS